MPGMIDIDDTTDLGFFRPGFYPAAKDTVLPAMVCVKPTLDDEEPDVQFILIKLGCTLTEWEDALVVSERDFNLVDADQTPLEKLIKAFAQQGYFPLTKLNKHIQSTGVQ